MTRFLLAFALLALAAAAAAAAVKPALLVLEGQLTTDNGGTVGEREWIHAGEVAVAETDVLLLDYWTGRLIELPAEAAVAASGASFAGAQPQPYVSGCMCNCGGLGWVFIPSGPSGGGVPTQQRCQQLQGYYCFPPGGGGGTTPPTLSHCHAGFGPGIPMMSGQ